MRTLGFKINVTLRPGGLRGFNGLRLEVSTGYGVIIMSIVVTRTVLVVFNSNNCD